MGQYKISIEFALFIGLGIYHMPDSGIRSIEVFLPFIFIYFGLEKEASGVRLFGKDF
jgi:hypothetical protein